MGESPAGENPIQRRAARAILLTPGHHVLLMHIEDPATDATYWVCPGGGLDAGEDEVSGLKRELTEELGRSDFSVGPVLYRWRHQFSWNGRLYLQSETFYAVEVPASFEPRMLDGEEARYTLQFRWWPLSEIRRSPVVFSPRSLDEVVVGYLREGPPEDPGVEHVISAR